jgi:hypothetical protein
MERRIKMQHYQPLQTNYLDYYNHIINYNMDILAYSKKELKSHFGERDDVCIATVGSDARLEKGPQSLTELVVFFEKEIHDMGSALSFIFDVKSFMDKEQSVYFFDYVDFKNITNDRMAEFHHKKGTPNEQRLFSPNRMFDARYLYGNMDILQQAKQKFIEELKDPNYGTSIKDKVRKRVREHRKVCETGMQEYKDKSRLNFDLESGIAFFNPKGMVWSFKIGPLRLVQYALVRDLIKTVRSDSFDGNIQNLPYNTVKKLEYLNVRHRILLEEQELQRLKDHYKYFVWLYHISQEAYRKENQREIAFDKALVRDRLIDLDSLCAKQVISTDGKV